MSVSLCFSCSGAEKTEVKASEIVKLVRKEKPVHIVNKIILDDLDFSSGSTPFILNANVLQYEVVPNIFFTNCIFMGKVTSNGKQKNLPVNAVFRNNLVFTGCDFRGAVNFDRAIVFGMVNFSQSVFREEANFNNLTVWSKDSYFSEMNAEKNFSMVYAAVHGNLFFLNAHFGGNTSFQESTVHGKLSFNNGVFQDRAGFDLMEIGGSAFFNYAVFEKRVNFSFTRFLHTADFIHTAFKEKADFEKAFFLNTVRFDGTDPKDVLFNNTFVLKNSDN
jgi:hypothetical protein